MCDYKTSTESGTPSSLGLRFIEPLEPLIIIHSAFRTKQSNLNTMIKKRESKFRSICIQKL